MADTYSDATRRYHQLQGLHLPGIDRVSGEIALRYSIGWTLAEIGDEMGFGRSAVLKRFQAVSDQVSAFIGVERNPALTGAWCCNHVSCCLAQPLVRETD